MGALQDKSASGWYVEGVLVKELTEEILTELKRAYKITENSTFLELNVLECSNTEIVNLFF